MGFKSNTGEQEALMKNAVDFYKKLQGLLTEREASGAYDPTARIGQLSKDIGEYEGLDRGNLAGAMRVHGYGKGDSEIGTRQDAVGLKWRKEFARLSNDIRESMDAKRMGDYSNVMGLYPWQAMRGYESIASQRRSNSLLGVASSIMPYAGRR